MMAYLGLPWGAAAATVARCDSGQRDREREARGERERVEGPRCEQNEFIVR